MPSRMEKPRDGLSLAQLKNRAHGRVHSQIRAGLMVRPDTCPTRCGGGLVQDRAPFPMPNGRPRFTCAKCGHQFTYGADGGPYASVVPMKEKTAP